MIVSDYFFQTVNCLKRQFSNTLLASPGLSWPSILAYGRTYLAPFLAPWLEKARWTFERLRKVGSPRAPYLPWISLRPLKSYILQRYQFTPRWKNILAAVRVATGGVLTIPAVV